MSLAGRLGLRPHFNESGKAKRPFGDETVAKATAEKMQAQQGSNRRPYRAYECPMCGAWHVGRKPAKGARK